MRRRTILRTTLALPILARAGASQSVLIDCNFWLGEHPNRQLPWHGTPSIIKHLRERGVTQAWACSFDALLHKDLAAANARLTAECKASNGLLEAVGAVNPALPGWQSDLEQCAVKHAMKIIRLVPGYHGYELDDPRFTELLLLAKEHRLLVQIVTQLEDERTQHPLLRVPPVNLKKLPRAARVMVLNANASHVMTALRGTAAVIDTAFIEGVGGVENLLKDWPANRLVFGSHAPWFYWEANKLKLSESEFTPDQLDAVTSRNALALLRAQA